MKKVVKIDNDKVSLASSEFNEVKVYDKKYFNFEPRIDDYVEIYGSGDDTIIGLLKPDEIKESPNDTVPQTRGPLALTAFILNVIFTIGCGWVIIPLAWQIPMTVISWKIYSGTRPNTMAFSICNLIFLSPISGILLLIDLNSNN